MTETNGDQLSPGERARMEQMRAQVKHMRDDFEGAMRRSRKRNLQRLGLILATDVVFFFAFVLGSDWLRYVLATLLVVWAIWSFALMNWPGRCVVCGRRTMMSGPSQTYRRNPVWLWWRPQPRHMSIHACTDHLGQVMAGEALKRADR